MSKNMPYITISLSKEDREKLEVLCEKHKRGKSNMISVALQQFDVCNECPFHHNLQDVLKFRKELIKKVLK